MKVHLHIENDCKEIEVHIHAPKFDETIEQLMRKINSSSPESIAGYSDGDIHLLKLSEIYSIFTENGKALLQTEEEEFEAKSKLYELEDRFQSSFIRVNKSMLVNIDKIVSIQAKVLGNPQVVLANETVFPVSRNYFKLLKEALGLGGVGK
ncbi:LytTR family DNA-binding domain-containing protein [Solibacillus ferritrahens]|uniref:LytTR family DNA-binding domain-containing protein n=1 Tax=Solibacillus ferritrahens TaxID=3098620 RepID=UPI00300A4327